MPAPMSFTTKPPIGGWLPGVKFSARQITILNAIADELIPPSEGFPAPSTVNVIDYIGRYTTPRGQEAKWFPFFGEDAFKARIDGFSEDFVRGAAELRVSTLVSVEGDEPQFFARLRDLVYLAYYSRPEVIRAINERLEAGRDYRQSPQPYGYPSGMLEWDRTLLSRVRGSYKRTADVARVNLEGIAR